VPNVPAGVPIVIGLQSQGEFAGFDPWGLREFLEAEFAARCARYPHSPFVLYIRAESTLRVIASAGAAACGITVLEPPPGTLALFCHLLIDISQLTPADAETSPSVAEPLEEDLIEFEAELKVEVIRLQLAATAAQVRQKVSRFGVDGPARDRLGHPKPDNRLMKRTDRFNQDSSTQPEVPAVPGGVEPTIEALYARADVLALVFQRKIHSLFYWIFALAAAAALSYGCFTTIAGTNVTFQNDALLGYVLLIVASYAVFLYAWRRDLHSRFVEYRALAEGLRVQHYWHACGLARSVAVCYVVRQPLEYRWIRLALWRVAAANAPAVKSSVPGDPGAAGVLQSWIDDQEEYFHRTQAHSAKIEFWLRWVVAGFFVVGVCASIAYMLRPHQLSIPWRLRVSLVSFLFPAVSAAIVALVTKLGLLYQASHYGRMQAVYDQARRRLRRHPSGATARIAIALGEEALLENESWAQFRRERGIDEPVNPFRRPW
jgi:hypothetical protein